MMIIAVAATACAEDDPQTTGDDSITDEIVQGSDCEPPPIFSENIDSCWPLDGDYQPRAPQDMDSTWQSCLETGADIYAVIDSSGVSSVARVAAFDAIAELLWVSGKVPTHEDFLDARILFEDEQGLGSRVARRYDIHYPAAQLACDEPGIAEANTDYCVGPGLLLPIINKAFADGALGKARVINAARIRSALHWFFYVSVLKEATTCAEKPKDCDSAWGYYAGGGQRQEPAGLGAYIDTLAAGTHDRIFDGLLALRCWRDIVGESGETTDTQLQTLAIAQIDSALLRGMVLLLRQQLQLIDCTQGDYQEAALISARFFASVLDRVVRQKSASDADTINTQLIAAAGDINFEAITVILDNLFECP